MDMKFWLSFLAIFAVIFIGDLFFFIRPTILQITGKKPIKTKKKKKQSPQLMEIEYLCNKFKLNRAKLNYNQFILVFPLINSFIITIVSLILELIKIPYIFKLLIGFVLLFGLIYALYEIYGRYLKNKEKEDR